MSTNFNHKNENDMFHVALIVIFIPSSVRLGSEDFEDTFTHSGMYCFASHLVHSRYIVHEVCQTKFIC